ncbi:hypothetical protein ACIGEZ_33215 [Streptomyces sp. NPDC085481]|uniref:hypothetical protein n=1 Tax=Streptomyces sp. NPDC085481 TaxID=3365727 RepID=UPI0037D2D4BB
MGRGPRNHRSVRGELGFTGIACTDWSPLTDAVIFGEVHEARARGVLPRSTAAVAASRPDVRNDTVDPVFPYGHGLDL